MGIYLINISPLSIGRRYLMERRKDHKGRVLKPGESQRKNLTYVYRYTEGESSERNSVYAKTLEELREKEDEIQKNIALGIYNKNWTLNDLFYRYLDQKSEEEMKPRTKLKYRKSYDRWVKDSVIGKKKISQLTKSDVSIYYRNLKEDKGLANGTIRCIHKFINGALNMAVEDRILLTNCAKKCALPYRANKEKKKKETSTLSVEQTKAFFTAAENMPYGKSYIRAYRVFIGTGLRYGELAGLIWDNLDFKNRIITVDHQFVQGDNESVTQYHIDEPKTQESIRKVPMSDDVYEILSGLKRNTYFSSMKFGMSVDGYKGFVFHTRSGLPLLEVTYNKFAKKVVGEYNAKHKNKLPEVTCHTFRRTFGTRMAESGMPVAILQKLMGHEDYRTTAKFYVQTDETVVRDQFYKSMDAIQVG